MMGVFLVLIIFWYYIYVLGLMGFLIDLSRCSDDRLNFFGMLWLIFMKEWIVVGVV